MEINKKESIFSEMCNKCNCRNEIKTFSNDRPNNCIHCGNEIIYRQRIDNPVLKKDKYTKMKVITYVRTKVEDASFNLELIISIFCIISSIILIILQIYLIWLT